MTTDHELRPSTYRHRPWLVFTVAISPVLLSSIGLALVHAASELTYKSMLAALTALLGFGSLQAFLVLNWRVRTVVDDAGVTQFWILRSYRMQWSEVTALTPVESIRRWYVRVHCGERTFETIPCLMLFAFPGPQQVRALLGLPTHAPRAIQVAYEDMQRRWKAHQRRARSAQASGSPSCS